jgi:hypothetical protein
MAVLADAAQATYHSTSGSSLIDKHGRQHMARNEKAPKNLGFLTPLRPWIAVKALVIVYFVEC